MHNKYSFSAEHKVWLKKDYEYRIEYSDGEEIENRIFQSIANSNDISTLSDELESHIFNWTSLCFLSKKRANLLRPFSSFFKGRHILEVGCGAGPITRFLGECGAIVTGIEPSIQRARIAAERCRDLSNVTIICDDMEGFEYEQPFDGIVQVGVLEYATKYSKAKDAPLAFLERLKMILKDDGFLITAIENQLGLKYFSGFAEDHVGTAMYGINDNYRSGDATTFGRKTLMALLAKTGFTSNELFLPFPDYKLPTLIFHPGFTEKQQAVPFDMESILSNISYQDIQKATPLFSMDKALPVISRNGLLHELSNSFCVFSQLKKQHHTQKEVLFTLYNTDRKKEFCKETVFTEEKNQVLVVRNLLHPSRVPAENKAIRFDPCEIALPGTLYHNELVKILNRNKWTIASLANWLSGWLDVLTAEITGTQARSLQEVLADDPMVNGKYVDALPINMIGRPGQWKFIDLEVDFGKDVELGYIIFRAIYVSVSRLSSIAEPENPNCVQFPYLLHALFQAIGLELTEERLNIYYEREASLVSLVAPARPRSLKDSITKLRVRPDIDQIFPMEQRQRELAEQNRDLISKLESRERDIQLLYGTQEQEQKDFNTRIAQLNDQVAAGTNRIRDLEEELDRQSLQSEDLQKKTEGLEATLQKAERHIQVLRQEKELLRQENEADTAKLHRRLEEKENHIQKLEEQVKGMEHEIYSLSTSRKRMIYHLLKRSFPFSKKSN
jgi:SAM-dependent methyltransferase